MSWMTEFKRGANPSEAKPFKRKEIKGFRQDTKNVCEVE